MIRLATACTSFIEIPPYDYISFRDVYQTAEGRATLSSGLLVSYVGHSSWHQWAVERLFHLDDVASLHN